MTWQSLVVILLINPALSSVPVLVAQNGNTDKCIRSIVREYFNPKDLLVLFMEEEHLIEDNPRMVYSDSYYEAFELLKAQAYIIVLKHSKVRRVLQKLYATSTWNPRAKFVIASKIESTQTILMEALSFLVLHPIVLEENVNLVKLFTWYPYQSNCHEIPPIELIDTCLEGDLSNRTWDFQLTVIKNWNRCPVRVLPIQMPPYWFYNDEIRGLDGIEFRLLQMLEETLNFKTVLMNHTFKTWGLRGANGTYTSMFGWLQHFRADIVVGMWPTNYTNVWDFDVTPAYMNDLLVWMVPRAGLMPHWKRLVTIFPTSLWLTSFAMIVLFPVLWFASTTILNKLELKIYRDVKTCIVNSVSVYLGISIPSFPRTSTVRILFISWVYFSLILITLYQSNLISVLTQPQYEKQITDLDDLLESGIDIGGNINIKYLFNLRETWKEEEIYNRLQICDLTLSCMNRTAFHRDLATAKSKNNAEYLSLQYYVRPDGSQLLFFLKSTIFYHYVNMVFARGHPMFPQVKNIITRFVESGIIPHWKDELQEEKTRSFFRKGNDEVVSMSLTLDQMVAPFYILLIGLLVSFVVFIVEVWSGNVKCKKKIV